MERVPFGSTGLKVSRLGVGLAEIGNELSFDEVNEAARVLNSALDAGINFLDTAACYSISEELVGRTVAHRRDEYILATKAGHVTGGYRGSPWTYQTVADSVDRSLTRMKTDHLDLVQLHSCGVDVLEKGDVVRALQDAKEAGKVRLVCYSGDNEAAHWAVDSGLFASLQTSFNLTDQGGRVTGLLRKASQRGMGVVVKRPIGGATWAKARADGARANRNYDSQYLERARQMAAAGSLPGEPGDPVLLALGFTFAHDEVDVVIVGTKDPEHMASNIAIVESGLPVSQEAVKELHARWDLLGSDWRQMT